MSTKPYLYINIRVPKCASTSLQAIVKDAFPDARLFHMRGRNFNDNKISIVEKIRFFRTYHRRIWENYSCFTSDAAWKKIENSAKSGDIISGHFGIDEIKITKFDKRVITLVRNPVYRLLSSYNYLRNGFNKRNFIQQHYHNGRIFAAGKYSFEGYLSFLIENNLPYGRFITQFVIGDIKVQDKLAFMSKHYFSFGTVEKIDLFRKELEQKTGMKITPSVKNFTENKARIHLNSKEISLAEQYCSEDIELYESINDFIK